jgi:outer membrane receptor protein involved in Fe transport
VTTIQSPSRIRSSRAARAAVVGGIACLACPAPADDGTTPATAAPDLDAGRRAVRLFVEGGGVHQLETDLDAGGDFDVTRLFVQPGITWTPDPRLSISFSGAYARDEYDFGGGPGFAALRPWEDVEGVRAGASIRWSLDDAWTIFAIPSLRFAAETGADLDDGLTGGAIAGASYRVNDRLSIGPGLGVFSDLEDSASVFPVLLLDWRITDTLSLRTGRGLGASRGPGLSLVWDFAEDWSLAIGGRFERFRFRLDDSGVAPDGVGEDESIPLFCGVTWTMSEQAEVSVIGGVSVAGELTLEDEDGRTLASDDYDPAGFVGLTCRIRF